MNNNTISLSYQQAVNFLIFLIDLDFYPEFDFKRNTTTLYDVHDQKQLKYRYPLILNLNESIIKDKNLFNICIRQKPSYLLMLIQTGNAALGLYTGNKLLQHKVIRKYMTRKKQGKSQLKYLKTKGKSRAGSRIRLANSVLFFEEINQYLNDWKSEEKTTIIYSCTPMLWGMLFQSKIIPPFTKKDQRLKKLPLSIDVPNFEILKRTAHFSQKGFLQLMPQCHNDLKQNVLNTIGTIKTAD